MVTEEQRIDAVATGTCGIKTLDGLDAGVFIFKRTFFRIPITKYESKKKKINVQLIQDF